MDVVSEIKAKISIEELASNYIQLHPAGRNFKALCPFHQEKTPSFFVSPEKQIAYCFGCHRGGDIFKFTQEMERMEFGEALKLLAEKAGVKLPRFKETKDKSKKKRFIEMHEAAKEWYKKCLWNTKEGEKILNYLRKKRGLQDSMIRQFEIGYAPDKNFELHRELLSQGYESNEIVEAGLGAPSKISGTEFHDRFQNRIMFPIWDGQGQVIAFGGRAVRDNQEPKYLNSPDTCLYSKSFTLYAFHFAKDAIRKCSQVILVEGYMDAIRCHESGFAQTVATCGTALTYDNAKTLKRFCDTVILFFDGDEAGLNAVVRAFQILQSADLAIKVVRPAKDEDPDSWFKNSQSEAKKAFENPPEFFEFFLKELCGRYKLDKTDERKKAFGEILPYLVKTSSYVIKDTYIKQVAKLFNMDVSFVYDEISRLKHIPFKERMTFTQKTSPFTIESYLLGCFIQYPETWEITKTDLSIDFFSEDKKSLYRVLENIYNTARQGEKANRDIFTLIPEGLRENAKIIALFAEAENSLLSFDEIFEEVKKVVSKWKSEKREERKKTLLSAIREAERSRDHNSLQKLLVEYQSLIAAH